MIVIEREGELQSDGGNGRPWIYHSNIPEIEDSRDIASAAVEAGYKRGDMVRYKIIIEPKK